MNTDYVKRGSVGIRSSQIHRIRLESIFFLLGAEFSYCLATVEPPEKEHWRFWMLRFLFYIFSFSSQIYFSFLFVAICRSWTVDVVLWRGNSNRHSIGILRFGESSCPTAWILKLFYDLLWEKMQWGNIRIDTPKAGFDRKVGWGDDITLSDVSHLWLFRVEMCGVNHT